MRKKDESRETETDNKTDRQSWAYLAGIKLCKLWIETDIKSRILSDKNVLCVTLKNQAHSAKFS